MGKPTSRRRTDDEQAMIAPTITPVAGILREEFSYDTDAFDDADAEIRDMFHQPEG